MDIEQNFINNENENEEENEEEQYEITCNIEKCSNIFMSIIQLNYVIGLLVYKQELNLFGTHQQKINFLYYTYFFTYSMRYAIRTDIYNNFRVIYKLHTIFDIIIIINTIISYKYLDNKWYTINFLIIFYILAIWYGIILLICLMTIFLKYYYRERVNGNRVVSWNFNIENMRFEKTEIILPEFIKNYDNRDIIENNSTCCICMENEANCKFEPCNHNAACYKCCKIWCYEKYKNTCPICRVVITKIYTYD